MKEEEKEEEEVIVERAYARVGLLGNPSDIYHGRTLAFAVKQFQASVTLTPNARREDSTVRVIPNEGLDLLSHSSIGEAHTTLRDRGFHGGTRLLLALLKVFVEQCKQKGIHLVSIKPRGFSLKYQSNVPFQVGLSGSSAIICAGLRCLVRYYGVRDRLPKPELPNLMLKAENDLGIVAGYMDRVIQVYGGLVSMDFDKEHFKRHGHGMYEELDVSLLPPELYLMFQREDKADLHEEKASGDSGKMHSTVRERWLKGEETVIEAMQEFRKIAEEGRRLLLQGKLGEDFAAIMRRNFNLRRSLFGDEALGQSNLDMVSLAESCGAAAKFTGSGGAVVVYCPGGQDQATALKDKCETRGFSFLKLEVAPATAW